MKLMVQLLPDRVGSPLSVNSLKRDLQIAYATIISLTQRSVSLSSATCGQKKLEVDFCIVRDGRPWLLAECKSNQESISPALKKMAALFPKAQAFQLTTKKIDKRPPGQRVRVIHVEKFLSMWV